MSEINADIDQGLEELGAPKRGENPQPQQPLYQEIGPRIPVSKHLGKFWKARRDQGQHARKELLDAWNEALAYYNYVQSSGEGDDRIQSQRLRRKSTSKAIDDRIIESENHVFINVSSMAPLLYMRNPEISVHDTAVEETSEVAEACEELLRVIVNRRSSPGINLLVKVRKGIVQAQLRNSAYFLTGYNRIEGSVEGLRQELTRLEEQWQKARSAKEIGEIEGKLNAISEQLAVAEPMGPWLRLLRADQVIADTTSENDDHSDAKWMMYCTMIATDTLVARFGKPTSGDDKSRRYKSIYKPTHVLAVGGKGSKDEGVFDGETLTMLNDSQDPRSFGFRDNESFERAQCTKVWYVWDKTTRRVFLFNDADWTWPLYVWDDPYGLPDFFPLHRLYFYVHPDAVEGVGEVSYYLDQQDAINEILSEQSRMRSWARKNVFFNKRTASDSDISAVLSGPSNTAFGLDVPEGMRLEDVLPRSVPPPSINFPELFDPNSRRESISRLAGTDAAFRGEQYRTNTTNQAIERYGEAAHVRVEMRTDRIEAVVKSILMDMVFMCAQYMTQDQLQLLIGERAAVFPQQIAPTDLAKQYNFEITVGSTQKPTSRLKKQEALELGQVLGQFAEMSPIAIKVMLQVFQKAFDEVIISDKDWEQIIQFIDQQLIGGAGAGDQVQQMQQIAQQIDALPPEAKRGLGEALARGVPLEQALQAVFQAVQGGGPSDSQPSQPTPTE